MVVVLVVDSVSTVMMEETEAVVEVEHTYLVQAVLALKVTTEEQETLVRHITVEVVVELVRLGVIPLVTLVELVVTELLTVSVVRL